MNSTPLVSVCVPCYNVAPYIGRLLTSLIEQTYKHLEIILVDDGSTDETHEIITAYIPQLKQEGYSVIYVRQENGGLAAAINTGLKYVTGEFFTWPDPDDWLPPNSIEIRVMFLLTHPDVHLVRGNMQEYIEKTQALGKCYEPIDIQAHPIANFYEKLLLSNTWFGAMVTMIRFSSFLEANGGRDIYVSKPAGQNWQLMLPIASQYECWQLPEVLGYYLIRENSHYHSAQKTHRSQYLFCLMSEETLTHTLKRIHPPPPNLNANIQTIVLHFSRLRYKLAIKGNFFKDAIREYFKILHCNVSIKEITKKAFLILISVLSQLLPTKT